MNTMSTNIRLLLLLGTVLALTLVGCRATNEFLAEPTPTVSAPVLLQREAQPFISISLFDDGPARCRIEKVFPDGTGNSYTFPQLGLSPKGVGMTEGVYGRELRHLWHFARSTMGTDAKVLEEPEDQTGGDMQCLTPDQVRYQTFSVS